MKDYAPGVRLDSPESLSGVAQPFYGDPRVTMKDYTPGARLDSPESLSGVTSPFGGDPRVTMKDYTPGARLDAPESLSGAVNPPLGGVALQGGPTWKADPADNPDTTAGGWGNDKFEVVDLTMRPADPRLPPITGKELPDTSKVDAPEQLAERPQLTELPPVDEFPPSPIPEPASVARQSPIAAPVPIPEPEGRARTDLVKAVIPEPVRRTEGPVIIASVIREPDKKPTSPPVTISVKPEPLAPSPSDIIPRVRNLDRGKYYLQLGTYNRKEDIDRDLDSLRKNLPLVIQGINGDPELKLMVGPLNEGESNAMLLRLKNDGYKNVFIKHGG
jgi:hypothetical protein